jgi:hypothetical protein
LADGRAKEEAEKKEECSDKVVVGRDNRFHRWFQKAGSAAVDEGIATMERILFMLFLELCFS